ncbi:MAG: glycosyltransferase family 4 protein [Desulfovibrionaceae bacterium]|nr:glycosyltransferase family 4 protein [Desulfovibrionaceae bacterium]
MKIVVLGNQARTVSIFWSMLMRRMRAGGHEVVCCVPPGDSDSDAALRGLGVRLIHYPLDRKGLNPLRDAATLRALNRIFRAEKPDLLFASTIKPVIYGCLAARLQKIPHIYATITGLGYAFEADSPFKKCVNMFCAFLYHIALAGAEGVFFQNQDDIAVFRQNGILKKNARTLMARGTGVDTGHFSPAPLPALPPAGPVIFLLVGRLLEAKGLAEYAAAAREVKKRHPQARFQLLGPPEQGLGSVSLERVHQWEKECGLEYLGETRDVRPFVAAAHVLVLPSWREGTPTAVMEAMSMGRPALVTDAPGCREVVQEGINGRMVPVRDAQALARAMEEFIRKPDDIVRMGKAGRELAVRLFDAQVVAAGILRDMGVPAAQGPQEEGTDL